MPLKDSYKRYTLLLMKSFNISNRGKDQSEIMFRKITLALSVFALLPSSQAALKDDVEQFLTPWMNAASSAMPLLRHILSEISFLQNEIIGLEPNLLSGIYQNVDQQLVAMEGDVKSEDGRNCIQSFRILLKMSTNKYRTDGYCYRTQQLKAEQSIVPLFNALFPTYPTPACPLPLFCKVDLFNFSPKNIRELVKGLKEVQKYGLKVIKFIVYFEKEITQCRNNAESYSNFSNTILKLAPICQNL